MKPEQLELGTLNPRQSDWYNDAISKDQIPLRRELIDRYDLIFAVKEKTGKAEREEYAWQKLKILERTFKYEINPELNCILLRKIIQHAKTFNPTELTEEAQSMLVEFFSSLNESIFPTRRALDVATRVSMAFARLHFSDIVTAEITKKALDFLAKIFREFDSTIVVIEDPRELYAGKLPNSISQGLTCHMISTIQLRASRIQARCLRPIWVMERAWTDRATNLETYAIAF